MENKKEIKIEKKDVRAILLIFIIPLLLTFLLEHLGEFSYTYLNGGPLLEVEVNSLTFKTPFGNATTYDVSGKGIGYDRLEDGNYEINSSNKTSLLNSSLETMKMRSKYRSGVR
jgi:hypothetical protein